MPMLTLNGQVINVFEQPAYTDKKTGEVSRPSTVSRSWPKTSSRTASNAWSWSI